MITVTHLRGDRMAIRIRGHDLVTESALSIACDFAMSTDRPSRVASPEGEWGLSDSVALRAFLEQVVYTATDEKSVHKITLTQNGGEDAVIATVSAMDYRVPDGDWGVNGSASVRALVQQLVFTASEEPGIVRVMITQNGEAGAIIGGEGLIIDRPQTRSGLPGE